MRAPLLKLMELLPPRLAGELTAKDRGLLASVEELRLRLHRRASLTVKGKNLPLAYVMDEAARDALLLALCRGSVYAYRESIKNGYIDLTDGVRVGLCGRALCEGEQILSVQEIGSFVFRIPHRVPGIGKSVLKALLSLPVGAGLLVFSPPNGGKTTLLRDLAASLSGGDDPRRVVLLDSRGEIYGEDFFPENLLIDVLSGYPREGGILQAIKALSPEYLVSDEIGGEREGEALLAAVGCGVPLLCSCHGDCLSAVLARPPIARLRAAGAFGAYVGITRRGEEFIYEIKMEKEGGKANAD